MNTEKSNPIVEREKQIQKLWEENKIFEKTLAATKDGQRYSFYDGPPFATGTPHYGHLVASVMKDVMPRYQTMQGKYVERRWGWDCHGLPIENIVEKELNLKSKKDIEEIGVDKFNELCRSKVLTYVEDWKKTIFRFGRFVDMENSYKTMDLSYMESVWWAFKELCDQGFIYEGHKSMHVCPRCETTLSQQEVSEGYKDIKDLSVTAKFELTDEPGIFVLAWTTTPWTLPGNVALAVGEDVDYVKVKVENNNLILAKELLEKVLAGKDFEIIQEFKGADLVGKKYKPLFPYYLKYKNDDINIDSPNSQRDYSGVRVEDGYLKVFDEHHPMQEDKFFVERKKWKNAYKIVSADFVTTEDGTGVVHIAPAFGEEDMRLGQEKNLPMIQNVTMSGHFTAEVVDFPNANVKPAGDTQATDVLVLKYLAEKNLLFAKEKYEHSYPHCWRCDTPLINYATSSWFVKVTAIKERALELVKEINWSPAHIKEGRFGKWLEGARDWSISRQRFWASVIPIWQCECGEQIVFGSVNDLEEASGEKINDLHKHFVDKILVPCPKCDQKMKRIPDVLDCWFESGSMPYAQEHYPFENKEKFEASFPAEFIAEGVDQTRAWFYYLHVIATAIKDKAAFKNVIVNGIVLAEDGKKMSKRLQNYPEPEIIMEKYGADALRFYLLSSPVVSAENLNFSEDGVKEAAQKIVMLLGNILNFYQLYADDRIVATTESDNIIDKWLAAKLQNLIAEVTKAMSGYDLPKSVRPIQNFIDDFSTWWLRRSRDRFKSGDEKDKQQALNVFKFTLLELAKVMAPFTPFVAEHVYHEVGGEKESVHLERWPEVLSDLIKADVLDNMDKVRKIVEVGLAERAANNMKIRQPLGQATIEGADLSDDYAALIADELNVKKVIFVAGGELKVILDLNLSDELRVEGALRELIRSINDLRKKQGFTLSDQAKVTWQSDGEVVKKVFANGDFVQELKQATITGEFLNQDNLGKEININGEVVVLEVERVK